MKIVFLLFVLGGTVYGNCHNELSLMQRIGDVQSAQREGRRDAAQNAALFMATAEFDEGTRLSDTWINTLRFLVTTTPFSRGLDPMDPGAVYRAYRRFFDLANEQAGFKPTLPCKALEEGLQYFVRHTSHVEAIAELDEMAMNLWKCNHGYSMAQNVGKKHAQNTLFLQGWNPQSAKADWGGDNKWHKTRNYGRR